MKIIKKINTSAALALDSEGHEIVVLGKGVGFPPVPYELTDLSKIERTFYGVDHRYIGMVAELPQNILAVSADIAERAELKLNCQLNPNLPFTLADHLNFACQRLESGFDLTTPLAYDICHLYPHEYALGVEALQILKQRLGCALPQHEAVSVAMHLINAEAESGDIHSMMMMMQILSDINGLVEELLHFTMDTGSYNYNRFSMHLRYLVQRLQAGGQIENQSGFMLHSLRREYPDIYTCALRISEYFRKTWNWSCSDEELVYLMMHLHRVKKRTE